MTLPVSGAISFNNINVELGVSGTTQASLGQASYRTLAGVASGAISMSNFYGKSNRAALSYTFASNTANASLNVTSISGYVAGKSDITITVNSGIYLYATSTGGYGLNLTGGATGDTVTLVNNGFILGQGGAGGQYTGSGSAGGPALNVGIATNITINNTNASAYIAGGGGGGAAGTNGNFGTNQTSGGGGGGAGGGAGGTYRDYSCGFPQDYGGGSGGGVGASGGNGGAYAGGGGGRILPGTGGSAHFGSTGGGGGAGGGSGGVAGGSGASAGGSDTSGSSAFGGGGGGWGASGGSSKFIGSVAGGKAVNLNGKSVTWVSGNTTRVYGAVS